MVNGIGNKIDPKQFGGLKGNSISHYMIELVNFVLYNLDYNLPIAVLACTIDFSKAFNRPNHNILITKLSDMGVPGWLLRVVISFLKERSMRVKYKGKLSDAHPLPGGGPQGALLGLFLFIVLINDTGFEGQLNNAGEIITSKKRIKEVNTIHLKYVDDLTLAEKVDMKTQVTEVPMEQRPQPDPFRARTGHKLINEKSQVLDQLKKTKIYADQNKMKINYSKTKFMLFNTCTTCTSKDFLPNFELEGRPIELVEQTQLLGLIVTTDLRNWEPAQTTS